MVRSTEEIQQEIISEVSKQLPELNSQSKFAIWRLWTYVIANIIHVFEKIISRNKSEIEDNLSRRKYGQLDWYVRLAYDFKLGYTLRFNNETGELEYLQYEAFTEGTDIEVIKRVSVVENKDTNALTLKVATIDNDGNLAPLDMDLLLQFKNYMEDVKIAGTSLEVISLPADNIIIASDIYFNPIYSVDTIKANLKETLNKYRADFNFSGKLLRNNLLELMRNTEGVEDVIFSTLQGKQGETIKDIIRDYEVLSGYFNYISTDLSDIDIVETFNYIANE